MSTREPGPTCPTSRTAASAVSPAIPAAPAASNETPAGLRTTWAAGATVSSANVPCGSVIRAASQSEPKTSSPGRRSSTRAPTASTTPATSLPRTGVDGPRSPALSRRTYGTPAVTIQSGVLTLVALTRTRTSSSPTSGSGSSPSASTRSGWPYPVWTIARISRAPSFQSDAFDRQQPPDLLPDARPRRRVRGAPRRRRAPPQAARRPQRPGGRARRRQRRELRATTPRRVTELLAVEPEAHLRAMAQEAAREAPIAVHVVEGVADRLPGRGRVDGRRRRHRGAVQRARPGRRPGRAGARASVPAASCASSSTSRRARRAWRGFSARSTRRSGRASTAAATRRATPRPPSWPPASRSRSATLLVPRPRARGAGRAADPGPRAAARRALGLQVGQHRQHAAVVLGRRRQVELGEDARDVLLDGALGDDELGRRSRGWSGPRPSAPSTSRSRGDELLQRVLAAPAAEQARDDLGIERAAALPHAAHGVDEALEVGRRGP